MSIFSGSATNRGGGDGFEVPNAGSLPAVLVAIVDLGTHEDDYQGKKTKNRKVFLVWELPGELLSGTNQAHCIGREFTLSFNKKGTLRIFAEKWRGKEYADGESVDIGKMLGKSCLLSVVHKTSSSGSVYAKVDSVSMLPKGMPTPTASRTPFLFEITAPGCPVPTQEWLPYLYGEPLVEKIKSSPEWRGQQSPSAPAPQSQPRPPQGPPPQHASSTWTPPQPGPQADEIPF